MSWLQIWLQFPCLGTEDQHSLGRTSQICRRIFGTLPGPQVGRFPPEDLRARKLGSTADQGHVSLPDLILLKRQRESMVDMGHHGTSWDIMGPWDIEVPCLVFDTSRLQAAAGQPFRGLAWIPGEVCDGLWILQTKEMDVNVIQQLFAVCTLLTLWRLVSVWPRIQSIQPPWVAM